MGMTNDQIPAHLMNNNYLDSNQTRNGNQNFMLPQNGAPKGLKKKTYQLQQSQFVDTLFNQTQAIGGFPMTSYDLTDIDMKQGNTQNLP